MSRDIGPKILSTDGGDLISALSITATDYTSAINPAGARRIGIMATVGTISGGSSPTYDITGEVSYDNGTTWDPLPTAANTAASTDVTLAQLTASDQSENEWWEVPFGGAGVRIRFKITIGGTVSVMPLTLRLMRQGS